MLRLAQSCIAAKLALPILRRLETIMDQLPREMEDRLRAVEDRLAIYDLLASHPIGSDAADAAILEAIYSEDTVIDRGPLLPGAAGRDKLLELIESPEHRKAIDSGLVHFGSLPLVELRGDSATATSYVMLLAADRDSAPRELPNHGTSHGYWIHRIVASRWTLERVAGKWCIKRRKMHFHDGSPEARELIGQARTYFED